MKAFAILSLLLAAAPAVALSDTEPVALVTDRSGQVSPAVELYDEVEAGTRLTLGPGASLSLEHYASCEAATVIGGSVLVQDTGLDLAGAEVADLAEAPCAQAVMLRSEDMVGAGIVLRGTWLPRVPLAPRIVVAGGGAGMDLMRIERDEGEVAALPVRAGRVAWPETDLILADQTDYVLVLSGPAGEHRAKVVADRHAGGWTVLRPPPAR
jgi:hypothetical protein